jgi:hypothetical protein
MVTKVTTRAKQRTWISESGRTKHPTGLAGREISRMSAEQGKGKDANLILEEYTPGYFLLHGRP